MLETSLIESGGNAKTRQPATVLVSMALHGIVIGMLLLVPLAQPQALPMLSATGIPLPIVSAKPKPKTEVAAATPTIQPQIVPAPGDLIAPTKIPSDIAAVDDDPAATVALLPAPSPGNMRSLIRGLIENETTSVAPPPPPPAFAPVLVAPLRVGSVEKANLVHQVMPEYPPIAKRARVQGVVLLEATISKEGTIRDLRVISGNTLLNEAAIQAVQQWRYKPTILNGEPVEVITTITVNFTLQ